MEPSSTNQTICLIDNVRRRVFLYDQDSPLYRDAEVRIQAWEEIGKDLNVTADEAKLTWDKLRRCFSNALNRRRQCTTRARKTWRYHNLMKFLEPHVDCKKPPQAIVEDFLEVNMTEDSVGDEEELAPPTVDPVVIKQEPVDEMEEALASLIQTTDKSETQPLYTPLERTSTCGATTEPARKRCRGFEYVEIDGPTRSVQYAIKRANARYTFQNAEITAQQPSHSQASFSPWDMDETDMFFLSMARMTKKLTLLQQAQIKSRLSHEVLQAVIEKEEHMVADMQPKKNYFTQLQRF